MISTLATMAAFGNSTGQFTTTSSGSAIGIFIGYIVFLVVAYLFTGIVLGAVFKKAGRSRGSAFIPVYNEWLLFEMAGKPGWWVLLGFIPFVGSLIIFVMYIIVALEIARRFGKGAAFAIFLLVLLPVIGFLILAYGKAQYNDSDLTPVYNPGGGYVPPASPQPPVPGAPQSQVVVGGGYQAPAATPQQPFPAPQAPAQPQPYNPQVVSPAPPTSGPQPPTPPQAPLIQ